MPAGSGSRVVGPRPEEMLTRGVDAAGDGAGAVRTSRRLGSHRADSVVVDAGAGAGDFNLTLLDHLIVEPGQHLVCCCNELHTGYPRARGIGAWAVTLIVGGLNAISGAYSENLPVICIDRGPNYNDEGTNRMSQELRCFQTVGRFHHALPLSDFRNLLGISFERRLFVWSEERLLICLFCCLWIQAVVTNLDDTHEQIDTALRESKPVYLSIPGLPHPTVTQFPSSSLQVFDPVMQIIDLELPTVAKGGTEEEQGWPSMKMDKFDPYRNEGVQLEITSFSTSFCNDRQETLARPILFSLLILELYLYIYLSRK
ncbi:hypothetical protein ACQ4PT_008719 [Festuca glaucescens]